MVKYDEYKVLDIDELKRLIDEKKYSGDPRFGLKPARSSPRRPACLPHLR